MVDTQVSKTCEPKSSCEFDSHSRHKQPKTPLFGAFSFKTAEFLIVFEKLSEVVKATNPKQSLENFQSPEQQSSSPDCHKSQKPRLGLQL